jgi:hypothetical protein
MRTCCDTTPGCCEKDPECCNTFTSTGTIWTVKIGASHKVEAPDTVTFELKERHSGKANEQPAWTAFTFRKIQFLRQPPQDAKK